MNQAIITRGINQVMQKARDTGLFTSLCTISDPPVTFGSSGAPTGPYTPVAGLTNLACMEAPISTGERIRADETKLLREILTMRPTHVLLDRHYTGITTKQRATVDTVICEILGVEEDSQRQTTRLYLTKVNL